MAEGKSVLAYMSFEIVCEKPVYESIKHLLQNVQLEEVRGYHVPDCEITDP